MSEQFHLCHILDYLKITILKREKYQINLTKSINQIVNTSIGMPRLFVFENHVSKTMPKVYQVPKKAASNL